MKNFTLKALSTVVFILAAFTMQAQNVNIPDANFKQALVNNTSINTNSDNEISVSEAEAFTGEIEVSSLNISDLTGIERFSNITKLRCTNNKLANLDVSKNTAIIEFHCFNNQLTKLDISNNTGIRIFNCAKNQLTNLDVSKNTAITLLYCGANQLTDLDLTNNTAIRTLDCTNNQLTDLDLTNNTAITALYCPENQLTSLDLTNNTAITKLDCNDNKFPFSELQKIKDHYSGLSYTSSKKIFSEIEEFVDFEIDYSSVATISGNETVFTWYDSNDNEVDGTFVNKTEAGVDKFLKKGIYYCEMTNETFSGTTVITEHITTKRKGQSITFENPPKQALVNDIIELHATATSGLEVSFEIVEGEANINGNAITFTKEGIAKIRGVQKGNDYYEPTEKVIEIKIYLATGIDDVLESSIEVYPNPVVNELHINFENRKQRSVFLYNLQGQLLQHKETFSTTEKLDVSDYKSGMYLLKIQSEKDNLTYKIIKR